MTNHSKLLKKILYMDQVLIKVIKELILSNMLIDKKMYQYNLIVKDLIYKFLPN